VPAAAAAAAAAVAAVAAVHLPCWPRLQRQYRNKNICTRTPVIRSDKDGSEEDKNGDRVGFEAR
jgi:hypothetical protein